ncbi:MAG: FadR family transcriptional regulator [Rhizobiaceae bacterium]|nr:FadR family transcriptional regulator [Rhizobiaceae bacterium]MCV0405167.1 FadR family transcriptional regulator [Rhizobiaceae bacterium]
MAAEPVPLSGQTVQREPRERRPKLADRLVEALREQIRAGRLGPGDQLPTEPRLVERFGVSRTVVREAITRLAADGLVEARQGAGVFVSTGQHGAGLEALLPEAVSKVSMVLNVLEVRMAIEMEAAALAAERRSLSQEADIHTAFQDFEATLARGEPTGAADFAFHRAIAAATNNPFYLEILDVLGRRTIPRDLVTSLTAGLLQSAEYQGRLQDEHRAIMDAVFAGDAAGAREAMRRHLSQSRSRYRSLLKSGGDLDRLFEGGLA